MAVNRESKGDQAAKGCGLIVVAVVLLAAESYILYRVLNSFHPYALSYLQSLGMTYLFGAAARRFKR